MKVHVSLLICFIGFGSVEAGGKSWGYCQPCRYMRPYCMQGCVDVCGCCIPCPYLRLGEPCTRVWSQTGNNFGPGLCGPGLICNFIAGVCVPTGPYYKPLPPPNQKGPTWYK